MTTVPREVLYAANVAVRTALVHAGKLVRHRRGRACRTPHPVHPGNLYLVAPFTAAELVDVTQAAATAGWWAPLQAALTVDAAIDADVVLVERIVTACDEYLRALLSSAQPHSVFDLRSYLEQAYAVTAAE